MNRLCAVDDRRFRFVLWLPVIVRSQTADSMTKAIHIAKTNRVVANVTYLKTGSFNRSSTSTRPGGTSAPNPTLIFIHGGNWVGGSKEASSITLLPFLDMGWNVVNIDYRLVDIGARTRSSRRLPVRPAVGVSTCQRLQHRYAPAGGERQFGRRSALSARRLWCPPMPDSTANARAQRICKSPAIINWYGFPDLADLLDGPNMRPAVVTWIGAGSNRMALAKRLSPITYLPAWRSSCAHRPRRRRSHVTIRTCRAAA